MYASIARCSLDVRFIPNWEDVCVDSCHGRCVLLLVVPLPPDGNPSAVKIKKKLHGLSQRANYTDRATAASRRSGCQLLRIKDATWSAWRIPTAVFSVFQTGAATFLSSSSWIVLTRLSGPRSRPTTCFPFFFSRKSCNTGNRTRASGSVVKNSDH
jgi:hypothetical protein